MMTMTGTDSDVTTRLAEWVCESDFDSVPESVTREAIRTLLNWMGCAVGGSGHDSVDLALRALSPFMGPREASLLGRVEKVDALNAALLNGISSHVFDFDDTHLKTVIHPAGPVASALVALAEHRPVTGRDFLHALILGVEVECRIGNAVYPAHYDIGWHITGTAGVFGAAAASGRVLALEPRPMSWALGIAATQAAGLREMFGSMCKSFHIGRAAQNGLSAALLAAEGFTSSERAIEAPRGFAGVLSTERDYSEITQGLGDRYEILQNTYKPFPCGIVIHPTIDGCLQLRKEQGFSGDQIEAVELRVHPLVLELTGKTRPRTGLEGKFSVYHAAAVSLVRGRAGLSEFSDEAVNDAQVASIRDRVSAKADEGIHEAKAIVVVRLKDGHTLEKTVEHATGSLERPMDDRALETKVHDLADPILGPEAVTKLMSACRGIVDLPDAAALARLATPVLSATQPTP